jgi:hypothetical protein
MITQLRGCITRTHRESESTMSDTLPRLRHDLGDVVRFADLRLTRSTLTARNGDGGLIHYASASLVVWQHPGGRLVEGNRRTVALLIVEGRDWSLRRRVARADVQHASAFVDRVNYAVAVLAQARAMRER